MLKFFGTRTTALLCLLAGLLWTTGCRSSDPKPPSGKFASVTIRGNTPGQIAEAATAVFESHGWVAARTGPQHLIFEKEGTSMSNIMYGNWMEKTVWIRLRANIEPVAEATYRLQGQAFYVRDRNGSTEEEIKMGGVSRSSYQKLLEEVAAKLTPAAAP